MVGEHVSDEQLVEALKRSPEVEAKMKEALQVIDIACKKFQAKWDKSSWMHKEMETDFNDILKLAGNFVFIHMDGDPAREVWFPAGVISAISEEMLEEMRKELKEMGLPISATTEVPGIAFAVNKEAKILRLSGLVEWCQACHGWHLIQELPGPASECSLKELEEHQITMHFMVEGMEKFVYNKTTKDVATQAPARA